MSNTSSNEGQVGTYQSNVFMYTPDYPLVSKMDIRTGDIRIFYYNKSRSEMVENDFFEIRRKGIIEAFSEKP